MSKTIKYAKQNKIKSFITIFIVIAIFGSIIFLVININPTRNDTEDISLPDGPNIQNWGFDNDGGLLYISWNHITNVTIYHVYKSFDGVTFSEISTTKAPITLARVTGLFQEDALYYFKVKSEYNDGTFSEFSNTLILDTSVYYQMPI